MSAPAVAVLGPSDVDRVATAAGIDPAHVTATAQAVGALLARLGYTLVCVPDRGVAISAALAYREAGGTRIIGITPSSGVSHPAATAAMRKNLELCDEIHDSLSWYEQHHWIGKVSDRMVTVGMSCGTIAELAWTKWTPGPPTALISSTSSPLPLEILAEADVTPMRLDEVETWLTHGLRAVPA